MSDKPSVSPGSTLTDWLVRGALSRIGDRVDRLFGRNWTPSSSLATSELIDRIKKILDAEARDIPGKGRVVPHRIQLKVQWDKFSTDSEEALNKLEDELLAAAIDHINDNLYYTYAPVGIEIKPDYFIEGVKLAAGFSTFADEQTGPELNVTVPSISIAEAAAHPNKSLILRHPLTASFVLNGVPKTTRIDLQQGQSISVGRIGSNELVIDDNSVSKVHASLVIDSEGKLLVADTGSTNGTFINDERIAYGKAMQITESDRVKFGTVEVRFDLAASDDNVLPDDVPDSHPGDTVEIGGLSFTSPSSNNEPPPSSDKKEE